MQKMFFNKKQLFYVLAGLCALILIVFFYISNQSVSFLNFFYLNYSIINYWFANLIFVVEFFIPYYSFYIIISYTC